MDRSISNMEINKSDEPIRLFQSDFLEFFTHVHPAVVLIIWLPVAAYFLLSEVAAWMLTFPPLGVNLIAFPTRLVNTKFRPF